MNYTYEELQKLLISKQEELDAALEREQALATVIADLGEYMSEQWPGAYSKVYERFGEVPAKDIRNKRDLLQRAEELEALAEHFLVGESHKPFIKQRAHQIRQHAQALK